MIDLAIGIKARREAFNKGGDISLFNDLFYVTDLEIGHYCHSIDDKRDLTGFKYEQDYYLNGSEKLAVKKRFKEIVLDNGDVELLIYFDYYNWGKYNNGSWIQDIVYTKIENKSFKYRSKKLNDRRIGQRRSSINDMRSLGVRFETMTSFFPQLIGYEDRMKRVSSKYQSEINLFITDNSDDFKNALLSDLANENTDPQLLEDLNIQVPTGDYLSDGTPVMVKTYEGIMARL